MTIYRFFAAAVTAFLVAIMPLSATAFTPTGGEVVEKPDSAVATQWQPARADQPASIWRAFEESGRNVPWEVFLREFVNHNRNKFPAQFRRESDFHLRTGTVYLVPVREATVAAPLSAEQQRILREVNVAVEALLNQTFASVGLGPETLTELRSGLENALTQAEAERVVNDAFAAVNLPDDVTQTIRDEVAAQFGAFEQRMLSDVAEIWGAIGDLQAEVSGLTERLDGVETGQATLAETQQQQGEILANVADRTGALEAQLREGGDIRTELSSLDERVTAFESTIGEEIQLSGWQLVLAAAIGLLMLVVVSFLIYHFMWVRPKAQATANQATVAETTAQAAKEAVDAVDKTVDDLRKRVADHEQRLTRLELAAVNGLLPEYSLQDLEQALTRLVNDELAELTLSCTSMTTGHDHLVVIQKVAVADEAGWRLAITGAGDLTSLDPKKRGNRWMVTAQQLGKALIDADNRGAFRPPVVFTSKRTQPVAA